MQQEGIQSYIRLSDSGKRQQQALPTVAKNVDTAIDNLVNHHDAYADPVGRFRHRARPHRGQPDRHTGEAGLAAVPAELIMQGALR